MSIKKTIIVTAAILASVAMVAPMLAGATTVTDMMAQISALQAQLSALQGGTPVPTGGVLCQGVTFTRNLTVGSTGSDVKCLQVLLNANGYTLAATGAGSPGYETTTFGPATLKAVRAFQVAKGFTPANQVGPMTRQALNALLGNGTYVPPVTTLPQGCTTNSGYSPVTGQSCGNGTYVPPVVTPTGAGLQVMLASDNPASGTIVVGSALTPLAKYVFVNGDNAPVKITGFAVSRVGVSADQDLANVYLLQGATRLTDAATVASGNINFNNSTGLFTIPAGSSVEITVASDIYASATAGETLGIALTASSNIVSNASSVRGNFPIRGNLMTTAGSSTTLAGVSFAAAGSVTPTTNTGLSPQNSYPVFADTITVSTRTVNLTRVAFREIGSVYSTDLQNFRLNIDGNNIGAAVQSVDSNGYVTFDLSSSPVVLQATGHTLKLLADVVNGSSRNFYFSIRAAADVNAVDSNYGANVLPTIGGSAWTTLQATSNGVQTIASGTITVSKAINSASGNVVLGASNQPLADYTLTAAGEPIKVTDLYFCVYNSSGTGSAVAAYRNGALYANGVQVGSTTNIASNGATSGAACLAGTTATHFSLGSALIVTPGSPVTLEVRADIHEATTSTGTANVTNGDQIYANLIGTSTYFQAQDMISLGTPTAPSTVAGNTLTVAQGTLALAKYGAYTNSVIVVPQTGYMLGHFTLTGSTTEATNINTIYVDLSSNTTTITNLYVKYGSQQTTPISTPTAATTAGSTIPTNSYSVNYSLPAGQTVDVEVFGDINSLASGNVVSYVRIDGITANSVQAVKTNSATGGVTGQTITFGGGAFVGTQDPSTPVNEVVAGGQPITAGIFKFTAQNDSYTINELKFSLGATTSAGSAAAANSVTSVALKDNATGLPIIVNGQAVTAPVQYLYNTTAGGYGYVAYFTGLGLVMPANTVKSLAVVLNLSQTLSSDTGTTNIDVEPFLAYVKVANSTGTPSNSDTTSSLVSTASVNKTYVFRAVPSVAFAGADSHASTGAQVELYKYTVNATGGPVTIKQIAFNVTVSDPATTNHPYLKNFTFFKNGTALSTSSITIENMTAVTGGAVSGSDLTATNTIGSNTVIVTFKTEDSVAVGSANTYQLKANVYNFGAATSTAGADSVSTYIAADTHVTTGYSTYGGAQLTATAFSTGNTYPAYVIDGTESSTSPNNFIWSDDSAVYPILHGYTYGTSADWYDGYLIVPSATTPENVVAQ